MADDALNLIRAERPSACGVLQGNGVKMFNYSHKGGLPAGVFPEYKHALVDKWVKDMWKLSKEGKIKKLPPHHGKCAEIMNIDEYLHSIAH